MRQLELYRAFCQVLRLAHTGQALDLRGHRAALEQAIESGDPGRLEQQILAVHRLKTGAPVRGIADGAAVVGRAERRLREAMRSYFCALGLAYQISDDVWDLAGDRPRPGRASSRPRTRPLGEDIRTGTITFPLAKAVRLLPQERMRELWAMGHYCVYRDNARPERVWNATTTD